MIRYAVNTGFIFTDRPLHERVRAAHEAGFGAIESFWPKPSEIDALVAAVHQLQMQVALVNVYEGDYVKGERGFAVRVDMRERWRTVMQEAFDLAERLACPNLNVLTGYFHPDVSEHDQHACMIDNLRWAAPLAGDLGVSLLLEPLAGKTHPGYSCTTVKGAIEIIDEVGSPHLGVQFDCYQVGGEEGEDRVIGSLEESIRYVRHIQIADTPDRGAPGTGNLDYPAILAAIESLGYRGFVGLEYIPDPIDPFAWLPRHER